MSHPAVAACFTGLLPSSTCCLADSLLAVLMACQACCSTCLACSRTSGLPQAAGLWPLLLPHWLLPEPSPAAPGTGSPQPGNLEGGSRQAMPCWSLGTAASALRRRATARAAAAAPVPRRREPAVPGRLAGAVAGRCCVADPGRLRCSAAALAALLTSCRTCRSSTSLSGVHSRAGHQQRWQATSARHRPAAPDVAAGDGGQQAAAHSEPAALADSQTPTPTAAAPAATHLHVANRLVVLVRAQVVLLRQRRVRALKGEGAQR
jgi:hypothetical protein